MTTSQMGVAAPMVANKMMSRPMMMVLEIKTTR